MSHWTNIKKIDFESLPKNVFEDYKTTLFCDIDETLTSKENGVNCLVVSILKTLRKRKLVNTIFSSGRGVEQIMKFYPDIGFSKPYIGFCDNGNGYYFCGGKSVNKNEETNSNIYSFNANRKLVREALSKLKEIYPAIQEVGTKVEDQFQTTAILERGTYNNNQKNINEFLLKYNLEVIVSSKHHGILSFIDHNKGTIIDKFIAACKIPVDSCFAIGNNDNDAKVAGHVRLFSVKEGSPQLLKVADTILEVPGALGIVKAIEMVLKEKNLLSDEEWIDVIKQSYISLIHDIVNDVNTYLDYDLIVEKID